MTDTLYVKTGTTIRDDFIYLNQSTFAGVTGKVDASFTKQLSKNGVGNQSTTGITIAEIDSTNNPGVYSVTVNAATGFVANTGEYTLRIYDTSSTKYAWEATYLVTADGTGAGTLGNASFTAIATNGRVTDGTNPVQGATVYIKTSAGALYTSTTTDVSGLWGPIFFSVNDTYSVFAQKSGYSGATGSITVSGSTATGPGADLAMSAVSTGSGNTLGELMSYGRRMVRDAMGNKADTDLKSAINDGLGMISRERLWPWFQSPGTFSLNANVGSTGTITVTQGSAVVTLSGATFPSWAASGQFKFNGQWCPISTRDSNTQVTMVTAWAEASTTFLGGSWVLFQDEYPLPADCQRFGRLFPGNAWIWGGEPVGYENVLEAKNNFIMGLKFAQYWAIKKSVICMWPYPQYNTLINCSYYRAPAVLVNTSDTADWPAMELEVLQRAIDFQLALRFGSTMSGSPAEVYARYKEALARAMPADKTPVRHSGPLDGMTYGDHFPGRLVG